MLRYLYSRTPLVILGTLVLLSLPGLGLIALMIAALAGLAAQAALTAATVAAPLAVGRAIGHRRHGRSATLQPSPAHSWLSAGVARGRGARKRLNTWKPSA